MTDFGGLPRERRTDRIGHYSGEIFIVAICGVVLMGLFPPPGLLALTLPVALFGVILAAWMLLRQHDRRLCEQCVHAMPLNPAEHAVRYRRRFWTAHNASDPRFLVPYLVVLVGSNFATSTIGRLCWAVVQLSMVYLVMAHGTHRRLQPWCPWCRDGGGGEEVDETPPVLPHDDRQRV